jgi:hypothetical protein
MRLELRNVGAKYSFERSHGFPGIRPNSDHRDYSRLSRPRRCSPHVPALGQFDPDQWFQFPGTFSSQNLFGRYYFEVDCMGGLRCERPRRDCAAEQRNECAWEALQNDPDSFQSLRTRMPSVCASHNGATRLQLACRKHRSRIPFVRIAHAFAFDALRCLFCYIALWGTCKRGGP